MKFHIYSVGKPNESYIKTGVDEFTNRISRYYSIEWKIIPTPKNSSSMNETTLKKKESEIILELLNKEAYLVALDSQGKQLDSEGLANFMQKRANESIKNLIFLIGGAYGLGEELMKRANFKWSLSALTFPHQLVRLILAEQIYRACTILKNEKYHH